MTSASCRPTDSTVCVLQRSLCNHHTDSIACVAELPKSPEWKSSSDPGNDERFKSENDGKHVRLDCRAKGKPTPKVTWFKDGQIIPQDDDRVQVSDGVAEVTGDVFDVSDGVVEVSDEVVEASDDVVEE